MLPFELRGPTYLPDNYHLIQVAAMSTCSANTATVRENVSSFSETVASTDRGVTRARRKSDSAGVSRRTVGRIKQRREVYENYDD